MTRQISRRSFLASHSLQARTRTVDNMSCFLLRMRSSMSLTSSNVGPRRMISSVSNYIPKQRHSTRMTAAIDSGNGSSNGNSSKVGGPEFCLVHFHEDFHDFSQSANISLTVGLFEAAATPLLSRGDDITALRDHQISHTSQQSCTIGITRSELSTDGCLINVWAVFRCFVIMWQISNTAVVCVAHCFLQCW